jgi:methylmalonyl-CoA mutase N-terminal domain/subunit
VDKALARLAEATERGENVMPSVIDALNEGATLGEVAGIWRTLFGEYNPSRVAWK